MDKLDLLVELARGPTCACRHTATTLAPVSCGPVSPVRQVARNLAAGTFTFSAPAGYGRSSLDMHWGYVAAFANVQRRGEARAEPGIRRRLGTTTGRKHRRPFQHGAWLSGLPGQCPRPNQHPRGRRIRHPYQNTAINPIAAWSLTSVPFRAISSPCVLGASPLAAH